MAQQNLIDNTLLHANPNSPYVQPTSQGVVRRGYLQQHGFVTPNSHFNHELDKDKVRLLGSYQRALISEQLPMSQHQPSSHHERELLVPLGQLQTMFNQHPNIARVPGGLVRQGSVKYEEPPMEDEDDDDVDTDNIRDRIIEALRKLDMNDKSVKFV
jgi:hypothetical protein